MSLALGVLIGHRGDRHVGEFDSALDQGLVDLSEVRKSLLLASELFSPLLDQEGDAVLNL